jgi:2-oxoglutarate dehydrogenase complex dehydrogenase (E1) component-like enzyme
MTGPEVDGLNTGYAALLLEQYLDNPSAVPSEWRTLFESAPEAVLQMQPGLARLVELLEGEERNGHEPAAAIAPAPSIPTPAAKPSDGDEELIGGIAAAMSLVKAFRTHGHLAAHIDPLGSEPPGDPALEPERLVPKLTPELMARIPAQLLRLSVDAETLADAYPLLRDIYCGPIAYEIEHISDHEERVWLRQAIESGRYRRPLGTEQKLGLLARLSQVEGMEHYLRRAFLAHDDRLDRALAFELAEDHLVRAPDDVREHVEAAAVRHPHHDLVRALVRRDLDRLVEHRHHHV